MPNLGIMGLRYLPISELPEEWKDGRAMLCLVDERKGPQIIYSYDTYWVNGNGHPLTPTHFFPSVLDPIDPDEFVEVEAYAVDMGGFPAIKVSGSHNNPSAEENNVISTHTFYVPKRKVPHGIA